MDKWLMGSTKLLWHMDRVDAMLKDQYIAPILIDIGATKKCNFACKYCYGQYQRMTNEVIPGDILVKLCADAPRLGVKAMTFTGDGEPALNPAIYDAVQAGKANGLDISFATNGYAINQIQNEVLMRNLVWCRYNFSAGTDESYSRVHGVKAGVFNKVLENIATSVEIKHRLGLPVTIGLQMVLIPDCIHEVPKVVKIALDYGVDYFVIKQFSDPGNLMKLHYDQAVVDTEDWRKILREAEAASTDKTQIIVKWPHLERKGRREYDRCVDCALIFQISGNSRCYPCGYLFNNEEYCYGDLKKQSLQEILESDRYWSIVRRMRTEFNVHTQCEGSCRHDSTNLFVWNYMHKPEHLNFI